MTDGNIRSLEHTVIYEMSLQETGLNNNRESSTNGDVSVHSPH